METNTKTLTEEITDAYAGQDFAAHVASVLS